MTIFPSMLVLFRCAYDAVMPFYIDIMCTITMVIGLHNLSICSYLTFQVGAISSQNMQQTLQSIRDCLENSDWATRKAAADTLCVFATHSGHLIGDGTAPTIAALEACRFDKVT